MIEHENDGWFKAAIKTAGHQISCLPGRFGVARIFGPSYSLRCVVFHDVSPVETPFTKGMGVSITPADFEAVLKFLTRHYTPVSLDEVVFDPPGEKLPRRPALVTFDDGYASINTWAIPLCRKYGVPAVIFLNAAFLDNRALAPDSLVCYAANISGMKMINEAAASLNRRNTCEMKTQAEVFASLFPSISLQERQAFLETLAELAGIDTSKLAHDAGLYLTCDQVRELAASGFEIGNHTYSHVRCRSLKSEDFHQEIEKNNAELTALAGRPVRSFSVPYGSSDDLTKDLVNNLLENGHKAVFLSESAANSRGKDQFCYDRVSVQTGNDQALFWDIEVMPRLRAIRNRGRWSSASKESLPTQLIRPDRVKVKEGLRPGA
jgi:peptidoglycan/xylan/chitin deacetylase (PgdA/CDA1 family)